MIIPNLNLGHPTFCVESRFCFRTVDIWIIRIDRDILLPHPTWSGPRARRVEQPAHVRAAPLQREKCAKLAQKMRAGSRIPVGTQLEKAEIGSTSGPTRRLPHLQGRGVVEGRAPARAPELDELLARRPPEPEEVHVVPGGGACAARHGGRTAITTFDCPPLAALTPTLCDTENPYT
jgi:hypothetical protein